MQLEPGVDLQVATSALLQATEQPEVARWIEFPAALLVFLFVPGDADSGAIYILDRRKGAWYAIDFEDEQFSGYKLSQLDDLLHAFGFLALVEQPGLWRGGLPWTLERGRRPEVRI